jgi:sialidase-1
VNYEMKVIKFVHICALSVFLTYCGGHQSFPGKEIVLRLEPGPENPRNSEGDFIKLKDGRILFIYTHFTSGSGDNATANLEGRISEDGGFTWSKEDIHILDNEGNMNIMSVSLLRLSDDNIALFYLRKNSESDCIPYLRLSNDEAKTWSEPKRCIEPAGYYVMNNDRVVQLKSGRILLPVALHKTLDTEWSSAAKIMCYYSDDEGKTWLKSQLVPNPEKIVLQEPGIAELKNGDLMMFCRTDAGSQFLSFSKDQGLSWSPVQPSNIKSPMSPASIERIPSTGDLLLVWNKNYEEGNPDGGKRTPFALAVSGDEGKEWEKTKYVESNPQGWYCYTAVEFVEDAVLLGHCSGDRTRFNGLETTQITRLSLDWVYNDPTLNPVITSDKNGIIKLGCPLEEAEIYFTLDSSPPSKTSTRYEQPIKVKKTTPLLMQAYHPEMTPSEIVSVNIGTDVYQEAPAINVELKPGLKCEYFEGEASVVNDIKELQLVTTTVVPQFSIDSRKVEENFAYEYSGYIKIPVDGIYTFYLSSNDGSRLYLNGDVFIDNDGPHGTREVSNATALRQGDYAIKLSYFQMGGGLFLKVFWKGPGIEKREIEDTVLFHAIKQ